MEKELYCEYIDLQYKKEYHFFETRLQCNCIFRKKEKTRTSLVYVNFDEGNAYANSGRVESMNTV